jgi:hypothetical protein
MNSGEDAIIAGDDDGMGGKPVSAGRTCTSSFRFGEDGVGENSG